MKCGFHLYHNLMLGFERVEKQELENHCWRKNYVKENSTTGRELLDMKLPKTKQLKTKSTRQINRDVVPHWRKTSWFSTPTYFYISSSKLLFFSLFSLFEILDRFKPKTQSRECAPGFYGLSKFLGVPDKFS